MKKLLTVALAIIALAVFTGPAAGAQKNKQKSVETKQTATKPPAAQVATKTTSKTQTVSACKVTKVDAKAQTFTATADDLQLTFDAKNLRALPAVGDIIDVTYTQVPGGPREARAVTVRGTRSNQDNRVADATPKVMTGIVTKVDENAETFTVNGDGKELTFGTAALKTAEMKRGLSGLATITELKAFLKSGELVEVTYTRPKSAEGTGIAYLVANDVHSAQPITGKVLRVNPKEQTFTVTANGKEITFSGKKLKALPAVGEIIDITYTQTTPGGPLEATETGSTVSFRAAATPQVMTGVVTKLDEKNKTFRVKPTDGKEEVTFSAEKMKGDFSRGFKVGDTVSVSYTQTTPGGPMAATTVYGSKSNADNRVADATPKVMTGKVVAVNREAKTFTLMSKGQQITFSTKLLKSDTLLKVGSILDVTYRPGEHPGEPAWSVNLNSSRSNVY